MPNASYVQGDFRGGVWSPTAQGRTSDEKYKTAMSVSLNGLPTEDGSWTRRPGFRFVGITKNGQVGRLLPFRFSKTQAYQAELTPGKIRFIAGLQHVMDTALKAYVVNISQTNPAKVFVDQTGTWANGDTLIFNVNTTDQIPSTTALFGRQVKIQNIDSVNATFELVDPFTGAGIDGAEIAYTPRSFADTAQKVLEFTSPYTAELLPYVRCFSAIDQIVFTCRPPIDSGITPAAGIPPYLLVPSGATQFTFAAAVFQDGPYLDAPADTIQGFVNTLTLGGTTGSVSITAAETTGINNGSGFVSTDVGRLIWIQTGPQQWNVGFAYAKDEQVVGTDNNIYTSLIGSNLGNDPTNDDGTRWEISSETVIITWLKITAVTDTLHATGAISGPDAKSVNPTTRFRLGVWSDTTGWPSCGCYHESRLFLGGAVTNRFDGSRSFRSLVFSPTETDGAVSDDNAVAATLTSKDAEELASMISTDEGMVTGTLAGEWVVKASNLDDPVTPTSIQARNVTTFGWQAAEPVYAYSAVYFIQAAGRKVSTFRKNYYGKSEVVNYSEKAPSIMGAGVNDLSWVQEPMLTMFARRADGNFVGMTHRQAVMQESFTGWHEHTHGMSRTIESLSYGPNFTAVSDSLYAITADGDNARWIECMMPAATAGDNPWVAWHTDGSGTAWYIRRMIMANGDSFDGLRVFGLYHLAGANVDPYIGGIYYGSTLVNADGSLDLPYTTAFNAAFVAGLSDGTDYGDWGMHLHWADAPVTTNPTHTIYTVAVEDDQTVAANSGDRMLYDQVADRVYRIYDNADPTLENIRVFDGETGNLLRSITGLSAIYSGTPGANDFLTSSAYGEPNCFVRPDATYPDGQLLILAQLSFTSHTAMSLINATSLLEVDTSSITATSDGSVWLNVVKNSTNLTYTDPETGNVQQIIIATQAATNTHITIFNASPNGPFEKPGHPGIPLPPFYSMYDTTFSGISVQRAIRGFEQPGLTVWYSWGNDGSLGVDDTQNIIREWTLTEDPLVPKSWYIKVRTVAFLTNISIDPVFTHMVRTAMLFDANDRNLIFVCRHYPTGDSRLVKINVTDGSIIWNTMPPDAVPLGSHPQNDVIPLGRGRWAFMADDHNVYEVDTATGNWTTILGDNAFTSYAPYAWYDEVGPSLIFRSNFTQGVTTAHYIGNYATANQPSWTDNWNRVWLGESYTQSQQNRSINASEYFIPTNFGVSFTSRGMLLRPDFGQDAGAIAGPAFGKKRRNHWWAAQFYRSFNVSVGVDDFTKLNPVRFETPGGVATVEPNLFSGIISGTIEDDYTFEGKIGWEITGPYPCTITAVSGYIEAYDK